MEVDFSCQTRMFLGLYETELSRHFKRLCRRGTRSFDIGAQLGYDALVMAKLSGADVVSVDLDPDAVARMQRNFDANPSLRPLLHARQAHITSSSRAGTDLLSLDDLARETFEPDLVKIDIEGEEVEALRGAEHLLSSRRPSFIIEVHSREGEDACAAILRSHGYEPIVVNQRRVLADVRLIPHNRWLVAVSRG